MLKIRPPRPCGRPVGRDTRDGQELSEPPAARFEARAQRAQAEGDSLGYRTPGLLIARVVSAPLSRAGSPISSSRSAAPPLAFGKTCKTMRSRSIVSHFSRRAAISSSGDRRIVVEELPDSGQPEHVADRFRIGDDPEPAANLLHLAVVADQEADPVRAEVGNACHVDQDFERTAPNHLVDPVREIRRPRRVETSDEDQFGDMVGAADLAVHEASFNAPGP